MYFVLAKTVINRNGLHQTFKPFLITEQLIKKKKKRGGKKKLSKQQGCHFSSYWLLSSFLPCTRLGWDGVIFFKSSLFWAVF